MKLIRVDIRAGPHVVASLTARSMQCEHFAALFRDALESAARSALRQVVDSSQSVPLDYVFGQASKRVQIEVTVGDFEIP